MVKEPFARTLGWPILEIAKVLFHGPSAPRFQVTTLGGQKFIVTVFIEVFLVAGYPPYTNQSLHHRPLHAGCLGKIIFGD